MFNDETKNLTLLMEECAEVIQICSKIQRFGWSSIHPDRPEEGTNKDRLETELGDVLCIMGILMGNKNISEDKITKAVETKFKKLQKYYNWKEGDE